jgi:hypothetical protein
VTLVWSAVIGILGALVTECFRRATDLLHFLFTGSEATIITSFERLPLWACCDPCWNSPYPQE